MPTYEIAVKDVQVDRSEKLGEGGFGTVYKGEWQGTHVALKVLAYRLEGDLEQAFREEMEIMLKLQGCPQLVRLFGAVMEGETQVMVMELMPNGNLYRLLRRQKDLDWGTKYQIALDVAYGLKYLHERDILHRDLKSMNVLLNKEGRAQIGDFGLAKVKTASKSFATTKQSPVGTLLWMAPELLGRKARFSPASDVYALGMVLYELLTHQIPFEADLDGRDPMILIPDIKTGDRPDLPATGELSFKELIEACWTQVPGERPMAGQVIERLEPLLALAASDPAPVAPAQTDVEATLSPTAAGGVSVMGSGPQYLAYSEMPTARAAPPAAPPRPRPRAGAGKQGMFKAGLKARLDPKEVEQFLSHVALGDQDAAEAMLKRNPKLTLGKGCCKDHAGREFKEITGFQYALWALDWHMWDMIQGYLEGVDPEAAREQCRKQEALTKGCGHGEHYDFEELLGALKHFLDEFDGLYKAKNWHKLVRLWNQGVGGAQSKMVVHIAQEYWHPDRPYWDVPDFTQKPLKRVCCRIAVSRSVWIGMSENGQQALAAARSRWVGRVWEYTGKLSEVRTSQLRETQSYLLCGRSGSMEIGN